MSVSTLPFRRVEAPPTSESAATAGLRSALPGIADDPVWLDRLTRDLRDDLATNECPSGLLDERLQFESLLVDLTSRFINLGVHEIDEQIVDSLRALGRFLRVDHCSFAELSEGRRNMSVTHCYLTPGIPSFPSVVEDNFPWYAEQIRRGEALQYARLPDDLPSEADAEREYCERFGLKSCLAIPLKGGGSLNCVITFATFRSYRDWPVELVKRLWLIGEVFANSLARKTSEESAQQLRDQLTRMARISLVGELAAAIAHEVNQPLCAIVSNAQAGQRLLSGDHPDLEEVRETLQDIAADSRRANEVVARVRSMLQKQTPGRSPLQMTDAVREVIALVYGQAIQKGVSISLQLPADLPLILGDRVQIQQVVLNLALNALDAMSSPEIEVRQLSIQVDSRETDGVTVSVRDSGPGIDPQHLGAVFDAFFTTKPTGLGVGLAISRSIIESHGGRIWVESEPGRGAVFHFAVPIAKEVLA